jgi:hypothetical protein
VGGVGSGRRPAWLTGSPSKETTEDYFALDIREAKRYGLIAPGLQELPGIARIEWITSGFGGAAATDCYLTACWSGSEPMRTWPHERLLGRPQKKNGLRRRARDVPKARAARTFSVSLSSVERYVNKAERGGSVAPNKRPGSLPKLDETRRGSYSKMTPKRAPLPHPPGPLGVHQRPSRGSR